MDRNGMDNATLRRFVDGELPPAEHEAVAAAVRSSDELKRRCDLERQLREAVTRAMTADAGSASTELRQRVELALRESDARATTDSPPPLRLAQPTASRNGSGRSERIHIAAAGPFRMRAWAVAASVALIAAVVALSVILPPIDHWSSSAPSLPVGDPTEFILQEHNRCAGNPGEVDRRCEYHCQETATSGLRAHLHIPAHRPAPPIFDLREIGYEFIGASHCGIPGASGSAHLMYRKAVGQRYAFVSVFMAPNRDLRCAQGVGEWVSRQCEVKGVCKGRVLSACDEDLHYWVTCCRGDDLAPVKTVVSQTLADRFQRGR